ncbi:MAG: hypothetical protein ACRCYR_12560 [Phycicoccus sp.]
MVTERSDDRVGSVAEEAARLVASLRRASESADDAPAGHRAPDDAVDPAAATSSDRTPSGPGASGASEDAGARPPHHDPLCQWCPVCRSVAAARQVSPEALSRLADLAALAATVLTDLARQGAEARATASPPAGFSADDVDGDSHRG